MDFLLQCEICTQLQGDINYTQLVQLGIKSKARRMDRDQSNSLYMGLLIINVVY